MSAALAAAGDEPERLREDLAAVIAERDRLRASASERGELERLERELAAAFAERDSLAMEQGSIQEGA